MKQILHVDVFVTSIARSLPFYVDVLGCAVVEDATLQLPSIALLTKGVTDRVRIVMLRPPGWVEGQSMIELMELELEGGAKMPVRFGSAQAEEAEAGGERLPSLCCFAMLVYDLEAVIADLAEHDIGTVTPIETVRLPSLGPCRTAFVRDPDGNLIELVDIPR